VQVDVAGINWQTHQMVLGECKWGTGAIDKGTVRELIETKTPRVLKQLAIDPQQWQIHHLFFAREGFTDAASLYARQQGIQLVDLAAMMEVLEQA